MKAPVGARDGGRTYSANGSSTGWWPFWPRGESARELIDVLSVEVFSWSASRDNDQFVRDERRAGSSPSHRCSVCSSINV